MRRSSLLASAMVICGTVAIALPAWAQIVPDNTLGNERSRVNSFNSQADVIEGGATRGTNLFHSFQEFNVDAGRSAYFVSPSASIQNILARVTGNNPSQILGRLGTASRSGDRLVAATANLFLINPNGIVFGKDATLDVDRSFVATTANAVQIGNSSFSATNPQAVSGVLNVEPSAFLFNQLSVSNITVRSNAPTSAGSSFLGLRVPNGQNLTLLGGNVNVEGGQLNAFGGRVEIGAIAGAGTIKLNPNGSLIVPDEVKRVDVLFDRGATVDVALSEKGDIGITARNIRIIGQSRLFAGINFERGTLDSQAGDLTLDATGEVQIADGSQISTSVSTGASGNAGDLTLYIGGSLSVINGARISTDTAGLGNAGNILIEVRNGVTLSGVSNDGFPSGISSAVFPSGNGRGGNILLITGGRFRVENGAQVFTSTFGRGNAGNLEIIARDTQELIGTSPDGRFSSGFSSSVGASARGNGGNLTFITEQVQVRDGAQISTTTSGFGNAGNLRISSLSASFNGQSHNGSPSGAFSDVGSGGVGNGGTLDIKTDHLSVMNKAVISVGSFGVGDAGEIKIEANSIRLSQGNVTAESVRGKGGSIQLGARNFLVLRQNSLISARSGNSSNDGNGGNIVLAAKFIIAIPSENSDITATGFRRGVGSNVRVSAGQGIFGLQFREQPTPESDIIATGSIAFNAPDTSSILQNSLTQLPQTAIDTNTLLANSCIARNQQNGTFYITGTGGLPTNPGEISAYPTGTVQPVSAASTWKRGDASVEPQGVYQLANGQLVMSRECQ